MKKVKKLITATLPILLATSLYANPKPETQSDPQSDKHSISVTGLAYSKHKAKGLNESHNWKGIQYSYLYSDSLALKAEYGNFTNSYSDNTSMLVFGGTKYFYDYKELGTKVGLSIVAGVQKGYCVEGIKTKPCSEYEENKSDVSFVLIPSLEIKQKLFFLGLTNEVSVNITYAEALLARFGLEIISW